VRSDVAEHRNPENDVTSNPESFQIPRHRRPCDVIIWEPGCDVIVVGYRVQVAPGVSTVTIFTKNDGVWVLDAAE